MTSKKNRPGINIQFPISRLIVDGLKTVETRTYSIPENYLNQEMYLIETPGPHGKFRARAIAIIKFVDCFKYQSKKKFHEDYSRHCVEKNTIWDWNGKPKWGWELVLIKKISPEEINHVRGIVFTKEIKLN